MHWLKTKILVKLVTVDTEHINAQRYRQQGSIFLHVFRVCSVFKSRWKSCCLWNFRSCTLLWFSALEFYPFQVRAEVLIKRTLNHNKNLHMCLHMSIYIISLFIHVPINELHVHIMEKYICMYVIFYMYIHLFR